jgi:hypothetical protein
MFEQVATRNCHADGPAAIEKTDAEFILQLLDLATQRRLCDMRLSAARLRLRSAATVEKTKFHGRSSFYDALW